METEDGDSIVPNKFIVTNDVLFGLVRARHCNEGVLNRVFVSDTPEFRNAIQETFEFLFQKGPNQAFFPNQTSWSAKRAKYLSTQFAKKWKEVCIND